MPRHARYRAGHVTQGEREPLRRSAAASPGCRQKNDGGPSTRFARFRPAACTADSASGVSESEAKVATRSPSKNPRAGLRADPTHDEQHAPDPVTRLCCLPRSGTVCRTVGHPIPLRVAHLSESGGVIEGPPRENLVIETRVPSLSSRQAACAASELVPKTRDATERVHVAPYSRREARTRRADQ